MAFWWTKTPIPHPFPLPGTHNSQDAGYKFKLNFIFRKYMPFNDLMMAFGDLIKTSDSGTALAAKEGQPPLTESPGVKTVWEALCGVFLTLLALLVMVQTASVYPRVYVLIHSEGEPCPGPWQSGAAKCDGWSANLPSVARSNLSQNLSLLSFSFQALEIDA